MRTRTIARMRRAVMAGAMAVSMAVPATALAQQPTQPATDQQQPAPQPAQDQQQAAPAQDQAAQQPAPAEQQAAPAPAQAAPAEAAPAPAAPAEAGQPPARSETAPVITESSPRPPPDNDIHPVPGTPDEYTIQKGDTLWDLSQKFLNNPWYWPKIWSQNPSIENPHWIYPGNKLRIVPGQGGAQAPAQVAEAPQAPAEQPQPGVEAQTAEQPPAEPQTEVAEQVAPAPPPSNDLEVVNKDSREAASTGVTMSGRIGFQPPPVVTVRASGMVTPEEMSDAGKLGASFEEKEFLATFDTAYVDFKGTPPVKPGDKLIIFHPVGAIISPATKQKIADQTQSTGVARVLSVQGNQATVQIEQTFEEIGRGDLVRPWTPQQKRISPKANTADVSGTIVQEVNEGVGNMGEANHVFIDKGTADGVQEGNTFAVVRHGDGLDITMVTKSYVESVTGSHPTSTQTPDENVGLLLVVDAREHVSTAIVIKSVRELAAGDVVEMHRAGAGGG
jgi:hypothetical protein